MMAYVGQTRSRALVAELASYGFGEMTVRDEVPPRRTPWAFDNGAFKDWTARRPFDAVRYERALDKFVADPALRPEFVVVPDIVAAGLESLRFSQSWAERLSWLGLPLYLVVQDGMQESDVRCVLDSYAGIFVGGSLPWKLRTGRQWTEFAHLHARKCHIGRMGTTARVRAARRWGADSIDSSLPLWSRQNLARFLAGFRDAGTGDLFDNWEAS